MFANSVNENLQTRMYSNGTNKKQVAQSQKVSRQGTASNSQTRFSAQNSKCKSYTLINNGSVGSRNPGVSYANSSSSQQARSAKKKQRQHPQEIAQYAVDNQQAVRPDVLNFIENSLSKRGGTSLYQEILNKPKNRKFVGQAHVQANIRQEWLQNAAIDPPQQDDSNFPSQQTFQQLVDMSAPEQYHHQGQQIEHDQRARTFHQLRNQRPERDDLIGGPFYDKDSPTSENALQTDTLNLKQQQPRPQAIDRINKIKSATKKQRALQREISNQHSLDGDGQGYTRTMLSSNVGSSLQGNNSMLNQTASATTSQNQLNGINLVLPTQAANNGQDNVFGQHQHSLEFMTLKQISENLDSKLNTMQGKLNNISEHGRSPAIPDDSIDTPNLVNPENDHQQPGTYYSVGSSNLQRPPNSGPQDSETQTELNQTARQHLEEIHEYKFQVFKLQERVKELEAKNRHQEALSREKMKTLSIQIEALKSENARLSDGVKLRNAQLNQNIANSLKGKDSLIAELTAKLKESTRVIQSVKSKNQELRDQLSKTKIDAETAVSISAQNQRKAIEEHKAAQDSETVKVLQTQLSEAQSQLKHYKQQLEELTDEKTTLSDLLRNKEQDLKKAQAQLKTLGDKFEAKQSEHALALTKLTSKHDSEIVRLKSQGETQISEAKAEVLQSANKNDMMAKMQQEMLAKLKATIASLEQDNQSKDKSLKDFESQLIEKQKSIQDAEMQHRQEREAAALQKEKLMVEMETRREELQIELQAKEKELEKVNKQSNLKVKTVQEENEIMRKRLQTQLDDAKNSAIDQESSFLKQLEKVSQQNHEATEKLEKKRTKLKSQKEQCSKFQAEIDQLQLQIVQLESKGNQQVKEQSSMMGKIQQQIQARLDESVKQAEVSETERKRLQQELKDLQAQKVAEQELNEAQTQKLKDSMTKLINEAEEQQRAIEAEKQQLAEEMDDVKNDLEATRMKAAVAEHLKEQQDKLQKQCEEAKQAAEKEKKQRTEMSLKLAKQAKENLLKNKEQAKSLKTAQQSLSETEAQLQAQKKVIEQLQGQLNQETSNKESTTVALKKQIADLELNSQVKSDEIDKLKKEMQSKLDRAASEAQQQMTAKNLVIEQLQNQMSLDAASQKGNDAKVGELQALLQNKETALKQLQDERVEREKAHEKDLEDQANQAMAEIKELEDKLDKELEKGLQSEKHVQELKQQLNKQEEQFEEESNSYEEKIQQLNEQVKSMTMHQKKRSMERVEIAQEKDQEVSALKRQTTQIEDGTTAIIIKFQDQLALKDKDLAESVKTVASLKEESARLKKQHASEIQKLVQKVNSHSTAAEKFSFDSEMKALKAKVEQRDNEIANLKKELVDGSVKKSESGKEQLEQLQQQCSDYEQDISTLQEEIKSLKEQLQAKQGESPTKVTKNQAILEDEIRRQAQQMMVKDAEIASLKKSNKQYKETIGNEDSTSQVTELAKKLAFADQEKQVKDMTIERLRSDISEKEAALKKAQTQEKNLQETVQKLTMQMAMMGNMK